MYWLGVSIPPAPGVVPPPVPPPTERMRCPRGYRYTVVDYGVEDFVVYLGDSGEDADDVLRGSPSGGLTLEGPRISDHLTITRTFFPPDNFNLLYVGLLVHGPTSVTVVVDSAQDSHHENVGSVSRSL